MCNGISVVIISIAHDCLVRAIDSVFSQRNTGNIQVLVGICIDKNGNANSLKKLIESKCPSNASITWVDIVGSRFFDHSGVHELEHVESLRIELTFLAKYRYVMYLDDNDWLDEFHCEDMLKCIVHNVWSFAYFVFIDDNSGRRKFFDLFDSVGLGSERDKGKSGRSVRLSGVMLDKTKLSHILHLWSVWPLSVVDGEYNIIFNQLKQYPHGFSGKGSIFCSVDPENTLCHGIL
ncbi:hypothetical protein [Chromobacterium amazonense]|uniref:hypothetical protein n=1 Tax=Chromobacterium amazonense TaxID=1382803 RepID=UPI003F7A0EBE